MTDPSTDDRGKKKDPARGAETTYHPDPVVLVICGDPVVGRALVLLLRNSRYDARFLSASSFRKPGALKGVRLLLLTPTLGSRCREALSEALEPDDAAKIPTLQLVRFSGGKQEGGAPEKSGHVAPWPCSTKELKQRIEAVLSGAAPRGDPPTTTTTSEV